MSRWLNRFQPWGVLLIRLVLGVAMVIHGYPKVVSPGAFHASHPFAALGHAALDHYVHFIATLGLPAWLAYVSAFTEFAGGIFLVLGLLTRFVSFLVAINMLVAIAVVDIHQGYFSSEYPLALVAIAIMLLFAGPGKAALDRKIGFS
jgi:putative oxidoreductase